MGFSWMNFHGWIVQNLVSHRRLNVSGTPWQAGQSKMLVIVCGSAASWRIRRIVNNKAGPS